MPGHLLTVTRSAQSFELRLDSGTALQANYSYLLVERSNYALYGEVRFPANPQRKVSSRDWTLTRHVPKIFVTPGLRLKLFPRKPVAPYFAVGAGYAAFEQSTATPAARPNTASRELSHGAFDFGGGVDVRFWRFIGLRAEVRDFYSGSPAYNSAAFSGGQHNLVAGGGFVLRFHQPAIAIAVLCTGYEVSLAAPPGRFCGNAAAPGSF